MTSCWRRSAGLLLLLSAVAVEAGPPAGPDFAGAGVDAPACPPAGVVPGGPQTLPELVDAALCRNPQTAAAWAAVRAAAFRETEVAAAYGPRLDASVQPGVRGFRSFGGPFPDRTDSAASLSAGLSLGWLLTDFGGREARLSGAAARRAGALAAFADQAQAVVLEVGLAYYALLAGLAAEEAARASLRFAEISLEAAAARERAGVGIRSDRLQAEAAAADAERQRRLAEGDVAIARGRLATATGLAPTVRLAVAPPPRPAATDPGPADALIARAADLRPDIRVRLAEAAQADAAVALARADMRPSLSLSAQPSLALSSAGADQAGGGAGLTLALPLGNSGGRRAAVEAARADLDRSLALVAVSRQAAALEVWQRREQLVTQAAVLAAARRQRASAEEAAELAQGRYRAGLAPITELLNAQAALEGARRAEVEAEFGVRAAELQLARAVGAVGEAIDRGAGR